MPVPRAPAGPGPEGRAVLAAMRGAAQFVRERPGLLPVTGRGCASRVFARSLGEQGRTLPRPSLQRGAARPGGPVPLEVRRPIESVNDSLKGRLDLEHCGGRGCAGVAARGARRVLAPAAVLWRGFRTGQAVSRSLTAYDP
ncbi:hypothetical protein [Streptomyces sp. TE5632]